VYNIASEILAFMSARDDVAESLRVALYIFDRDDAAGLPKELVDDGGAS
jgi:hypothetical protein